MRGVRFVSGVTFAAAAWACSGGAGPTSIPTTENEPAGTNLGPEPGAKGPESGSTGPEPANPIGDPTSTGTSSSSGGTTGTAGGTCSYCGKTYNCAFDGTPDFVTLRLTEEDGVCVVSTGEDGGATGVFSCDGTLTLDAASLSWTADGSGGFTSSFQAVLPGAGAPLNAGSLACDPS